jgi:hypothetical protein
MAWVRNPRPIGRWRRITWKETKEWHEKVAFLNLAFDDGVLLLLLLLLILQIRLQTCGEA